MPPTLALWVAAAGVGLGHAVLPDHWIPLAVVARAQRYSLRRALRLSLAAAVTHVLLSVILGAIIILVGLQFRASIEAHTNLVVGGVLALTGLVLLIVELTGRGHRHNREHGHGHGHGHGHDDHHHRGPAPGP
jgi:nickel/cobalt transporter (NicO) family protein